MNRFFRNIFFMMLFIIAAAVMIPADVHASDTPASVCCYVSVNGEWTQIDKVTVSKDTRLFSQDSKQNRYYITAAQLEKIYRDYGFKADDYKGEKVFAHTEKIDTGTVLADIDSVKNKSGDYIVPLCVSTDSKDKTCLYYLPAGPVTSSGSKVSSFKADDKDDSGVSAANTFYTVKVSDSRDYLPAASKAKLPDTTYILNGSSDSIVLPLADGVSYKTLDSSGSDLKLTRNKSSKTVTAKISNITENTRITTYEASVMAAATVTCYVAIDGKWTGIKEYTTSKQKWLNGATRYYITPSELETIYGDYGFKADKFDGSRIFPHSDSNSPNNIWADQPPVKDSSAGYIVPLSNRTQIYLYYMPVNKNGSSTYFDNNISKNNENALKANSFFTVKFSDAAGLLPKGSELPDEMMLFSGESKEITLPKLEGESTYIAANGTTGKRLDVDKKTNDASGTVTISVKDISCPVVIRTSSGMPAVVYNAAVKPSLKRLGDFNASSQTIIKDGTIKGSNTYYDGRVTLETPYVVSNVDDDKAMVSLSSSNNRHVAYTFTGWRLGSSDTIYQPGDLISPSVLEENADDSDEVTLNAFWDAVDSKSRINSVNFFVNLDCEISDNQSDGFNSTHTNKFTNSIFASRVFDTDNVPGTGNYQLIAPPTANDTAYEVDKSIRASTRTPLNYGVMLEQVPSDEEVLAHIRNGSYTITLNGETIPSSRITSEYFTVRWHVLKYDHSDGWHVDGILVAKEGKLVVTKSFDGDDEAIQKVKDSDFDISVTHTENSSAVSDYSLSLNSADSETDKTKTGYTSYDKETDTYTWVLTARQDRQYLIKEENYILDTDKWNNTNRYSIYNSSDKTKGWHLYDANKGVSVTAEAYPNDMPSKSYQTVAFKNMYVQSGLITFSKVDSTTGNGLKNVSFKLSLDSGNELLLYRKPGTSEYSTDANAQHNG